MTGIDTVLYVIVVVAIVAVAAVALWRIGHMRGRLAAAEAQVAQLAADLDAAPFDLSQTLGDGNRKLITIEILNPIEVAGNEFKLARQVGGLAPKLIRSEVTRRAVQELEAELAEKGIEAEVRVHDGA